MIRESIRSVVSARKLTPYRVAKAAGVSIDSVARFLDGSRGLQVSTLDAICGALGLVLVEGGGSVAPPRADATTAMPGPLVDRPHPGEANLYTVVGSGGHLIGHVTARDVAGAGKAVRIEWPKLRPGSYTITLAEQRA
jgi:transcriptional regulator with XRE-family HTH domain